MAVERCSARHADGWQCCLIDGHAGEHTPWSTGDQPDPASWESDHQRTVLEWLDAKHGTSLAGEFPFGCDTVEHVAEALIALRTERRLTVEEVIERYREHMLNRGLKAPLFLDVWSENVRRALTEEPS